MKNIFTKRYNAEQRRRHTVHVSFRSDFSSIEPNSNPFNATNRTRQFTSQNAHKLSECVFNTLLWAPQRAISKYTVKVSPIRQIIFLGSKIEFIIIIVFSKSRLNTNSCFVASEETSRDTEVSPELLNYVPI